MDDVRDGLSTLRRRRRAVFLVTLALMAATVAWLFARSPAGGPAIIASANAYRIPLAPDSKVAQTWFLVTLFCVMVARLVVLAAEITGALSR